MAADGAMLPKTSSWRYSHGPTTTAKSAAQPIAAVQPMTRLCRGHSSHRNASAKGTPSSTPSERASVARPTTRPPATKARRLPCRPLAHSHSASAPRVMNRPKLSGWPKNGVSAPGTAASRPAQMAKALVDVCLTRDPIGQWRS